MVLWVPSGSVPVYILCTNSYGAIYGSNDKGVSGLVQKSVSVFVNISLKPKEAGQPQFDRGKGG